MSKTQLVTFTPTDAFFFGGDSTFGNGDNRNFYAASNVFPQQTTLVGVLRHALFEAGYPDNIGQSFVVQKESNKSFTPNFGYLKKVSPVFIYHQPSQNFAIPVRLVELEGKEEAIPIEVKSSPNIKVNFGKSWEPALSVLKYKEKHGISSKLLCSTEENTLLDYEDVFETITKTGIARDRKAHTTLEGMFYQQSLFKLKAGYAFGAFVTGTEELFSAIQQRNMPMGGEKKNFVIQTHHQEQRLKDLFETAIEKQAIKAKQPWIYLVSDAYIAPDIYDHCQLAISETQPFRNIITPDSQYYSAELVKEKHAKKRYKSKQFMLLKRGTVLFPKDTTHLATITAALEEANEFKAIGYNHYFTNPKTI